MFVLLTTENDGLATKQKLLLQRTTQSLYETQSGTFRLADQGHSIASPYWSVGLLVSNSLRWIKNGAVGEEVMTLTCQEKLHWTVGDIFGYSRSRSPAIDLQGYASPLRYE
jgi:hypothetical protein